MSRRGHAKPAGIQLFPFLAVLICTMGALVVLLHAFASHGREQALKAAKAKQKEHSAQDELDADYFHWRTTHLRDSRTKTQADLEAERLKLSHIEDHQRRLEERLNELKIAAAQLEKSGESKDGKLAENEAELAKVQDELAKANVALDEARKKGKHEAVNYSIVPFNGRHGTHRRPIYIECCESKIILQPEGIELSPADFIGYFGPGNPLAAGLRAQREYFANLSPGGKLEEEPYPLLIVRPEGIASYYAARAALDSWGSDFGYELIGADWTINFPPSDPQLKLLTAKVVNEARQRLVEYIAASPQFQRSRSKPVYHAKSHGGVAQDPGTGDGPGGSFLGDWDKPGEWGGSESEPRGSGGAYTAGGDGNSDVRGTADASMDPYAPLGATGGDPYAEPGSIGPQMRGGPRSGTIDGNQFAQMQQGSASSSNIPGIGPGGVKAQDGGSGGTSSAERKFEGPGGGGIPQTRVGPATVGGGPSHAQSPAGAPKTGSAGQPGTQQQANAQQQPGQPGAESKNNYDLMAGSGQATASGAPDASQMPSISAGAAAQSASAQNAASQSMSLNHSPGSSAAGKHQQATQSIAATRGRGWGVNSQVGAIGASRPILIRCSADKLVIVPDARGQATNEISLGPKTEASIDDLVAGVWTQTESWGKAGRGMYWKPTLVVEVQPGGEERFRDLQVLLAESGLDVQKRGGQAAAKQPTRPANQR
jgi:hypothetical protein